MEELSPDNLFLKLHRIHGSGTIKIRRAAEFPGFPEIPSGIIRTLSSISVFYALGCIRVICG